MFGMPTGMPSIDWAALAPLVWLSAGGLAVVLIAVGPAPVRRWAGPVSIAFIAAAARAVWVIWPDPRISMGGMVAADRFALAFDVLFLATAALSALLAMASLRREGVEHGEYYGLLLIATAGMMMMAGSTNLLGLFLGLEILSVPLYVMCGFSRVKDRALESSMKYFLMGAFSTGFTLYGVALLYGATHTLDLRQMAAAAALGGTASRGMLLAGFALTLIGFLFKIAAFPFHFWLPDVYQGAPTAVTGYMIAGTKAAGFAAILRILTTAFWAESTSDRWAPLIAAIAALTMVAGNVVALAQNNVKRMLAYSSIAHAGYVLVAVACRTGDGISSVVFYLASYLFMNLGAFAIVSLVEGTREGDEVGELFQAYAGLGRREPLYAAAMAIFVLSLIGLPLTGGFVGKFLVFRSALDAGLLPLAIVAVLNAVVAAAYYLPVIVYMYFREPATEPARIQASAPATIAILASLAGVFFLGLDPSPIVDLFSGLL